MSNYLSEDGTFINSLIGEGSFFRGDISLNGLLRIDGDFRGSIKDGGKVLVGKSGRAEAAVSADIVVIGGVLKGNVVASEKVVILSTGMVIGNITAPRLLIEDGVIFNGSCSVSENKAYSGEVPAVSQKKASLFSPDDVREMEPASTWNE